MSEKYSAHTALVVIDVQNDFLPGGALAVPRGDEVVPIINRAARAFERVVLTQDWHPAHHISFASTHGAAPFSSKQLPYGDQTLWPTHCVQQTEGAALAPKLHIPHAQLVIRKGWHQSVDSYSAFTEADRTTTTGLAAYLRAHGVQQVVLVGLALDYCVADSAIDARAAGFECVVLEDACRAIDLNGSLEKAWQEMLHAGVVRSATDEWIKNSA